MSERKTAFPLATSSWDGREYGAIERVVNSGQFSMGAEVAEFERKFSAMMGSAHAVMANSGSSANLLMIAALRYHSSKRLDPGDEVIVPAVSWSTTYFPLHQYGLKTVFVDVDQQTLNFDLNALDTAITSRTKAILAVNLLGNPNDFSAIRAMCGGRDILLLEDNCESLGAVFDGRHTGTFGLAGSYSTYFSHHISTMEGGVVVTDDEELHQIMLSLRSHGWTRNLPQVNCLTGQKSNDAFEESFRFILPGYNLRPLEMSGAIGIEQLGKLPTIVAERQANARRFKELMTEFPEIQTQREIGRSSWFGFSILLPRDGRLARKEFAACLTASGIECRPIVAGNFAKNPVVARYFDYATAGDLKNARFIDSSGLFVGNHHYPMHAELELLRSALRRALGR